MSFKMSLPPICLNVIKNYKYTGQFRDRAGIKYPLVKQRTETVYIRNQRSKVVIIMGLETQELG